MNRITSSILQESYCEETMPNGLHVVIWQKPEFSHSHVMLATPYGSLDREQVDPEGNHYQFPAGIAHFLEHKLFESDHGDVMNDFQMMGANVNAYTSYDQTAYYFETPEQDLSAPLSLLLDFVQDLSISEESVEREKSIILQELNGYAEDASSRLDLETYRAMYRNHPIRLDICGTEESIREISRHDLEECYRLNYHPGRMMLIAVTPADPASVLEIIAANQKDRQFGPWVPLKRYTALEPLSVEQAETHVSMELTEPRICLGVKLPVPAGESDHDRDRREWAISIAMDAWFSSVNPQYQSWLDQGLITSYFNYDSSIERDFAMLQFYDRGRSQKQFCAFLRDQMAQWQKSEILPQVVGQLKRRSIGTSLHLFNHPSEIAMAVFNGVLKGVSVMEEIHLLEAVDDQMINQTVRRLDLSHQSCAVLEIQ